MSASELRVALVHDWLTGMRGGEYVLEAIAELFPQAELFTLLRLPEKLSPQLRALPCHTALLQRVPNAETYYRHFLPLMPQMIEAFDLSGFDLIISSSHCVAKGVRKPAGAVHVSYVHAPMRYMWERFDDYFGREAASLPVRLAARAVRGYLQRWDRSVSGAERVDMLVANSRFIASQVERAYGRKVRVVHPFVDLARFTRARAPGREYLMVGAFAPNKRVDLAIDAFNRLQLPLLIVGQGQKDGALRKLAGPTIRFLGALPNTEIEGHYARARAFIFPGIEDFGITPLEAMAAGVPVIAYGHGGACETVVAGETGLLFAPQSVEALMAAVERVENGECTFDEARVRARAHGFTREKFQADLLAAVTEAWCARGKSASALAHAGASHAHSSSM